MVSAYRHKRLVYERGTGALKLLDNHDLRKVIWQFPDKDHTNSNMGPGWLVMQWDGNLVAHNEKGQHYWSTGTMNARRETEPTKRYTRLNDDGRLQIQEENGKVVFQVPK